MKKIIIEEKKENILVSELKMNEIIAYRCKSEVNCHAILTKINIVDQIDGSKLYGYGFVPLNRSDSNIRYSTGSAFSSIEKAIKGGRDL